MIPVGEVLNGQKIMANFFDLILMTEGPPYSVFNRKPDGALWGERTYDRFVDAVDHFADRCKVMMTGKGESHARV